MTRFLRRPALPRAPFLSAAVACLLALAPARLSAAPAAEGGKVHRVVVQLTTDSEDVWTKTLGQIENLKKGLAPEKVEVEIVTHGDAAGFVLAKNEALSARIRKLEAEGGSVAFCANTQKKNGIKPEEITPGVVVIPSGIVHVVRRQEEGWSYIKAGP